MSIEEMIADLQANMRLGTDQNCISRNRIDINGVRERLQQKMKVLDALHKANQAMCEHPKDFQDVELTNNGHDGWTSCKLCGAVDI